MRNTRRLRHASRISPTRMRAAWALAVWGLLAGLAGLVGGAIQQNRLVAPIITNLIDRMDKTEFTGPPRLMHVDDEMVSYLRKAAEQIKAGQFDQAIAILQALIQRPEGGFFPESDGRYVSMRTKASELVGAMGEKGLKLYRSLYDSQARRLYEQALGSSRPEEGLRRVSERYLHTTCGPKALESLGEIYFDRAEFSQAIGCWLEMLGSTPEGPETGRLLARIAAARSLAGQKAEAERIKQQLRDKYADVSDEYGGRSEKLVSFVDRVSRLGRLETRLGPSAQTGWPGMGGLAQGLGIMSECDVVLVPHEQWPERPSGELAAQDLTAKLEVGREMYLSNPRGRSYTPYGVRTGRRVVQLRDGLLQERGVNGNSRQAGTRKVLPAMLHVAVADGRVFIRGERSVLSLDLRKLSGGWESVPLPMVRRLGNLPNVGYYYSSGTAQIGDNGRYALTVGGGKVFTVYDFLPSNNNLSIVRQRMGNVKGLDEGSRMAGLSIRGQCMVLWTLGRGDGDADVLRGGMFLTAPTYAAGRLYTVVYYLQSYVLVCLDAETGKLIWRSPIAQAPATSSRPYQLGAQGRLAMGSPPAVADGRVYVTTNAGAIAAMDAETGEPIWGYQYDSAVNKNSRGGYRPTSISRSNVWVPGNPLVVSHGLVICLPADCDDVLALRGDTGRLEWSTSRRGQLDMTAIDPDRVLLSGKGLFVYSIADGEKLTPGHEDLDIYGRPAVTDRRVLASSLGRICSMDLKTYDVRNIPLSRPDGMLGNLVSADGRLIASSMLGVCTYMGFDRAMEELNERVAKASPAARGDLMLKRAQLAFDDKRFDLAMKCLLECQDEVRKNKDTETAAQLKSMMYRTYIALGNHASDHGVMREMFTKAASLAESKQEQGHMTLRLARCAEKGGQYAEAASLAQKVADDYGDEDLVDVAIGSQADDTVRFGEQRATLPGKRIAKDYIGKLIEIYGRKCYAKFDAEADKALAAARAEGDPNAILGVQQRWPNAACADDSLFYAAEVLYSRAGQDANSDGDALGEARRYLYRIWQSDGSAHRVSAGAALAVIYTRGQWRTTARNMVAGLRKEDPKTPVAFADIRGTLGDVLGRLESGDTQMLERPMATVGEIHPPLVQKFLVKGTGVEVLTDQFCRPLRVDDKVGIVNDGDVMMLDAAREPTDDDWRTPAGIDKVKMKRYASLGPGMRLIGALSRDQSRLVVADRDGARGLDVLGGKTKWHAAYNSKEVGIGSFYCMGVGQGVLVVVDTSGKVVCLDLSNGKKLWENKVVGMHSRLPFGPPIIGGGLVVFRADNGKTITAMSLSRQGKVVGTWTGHRHADAEITDDGILLMMVDGVLTAREAATINKPVWTVKYDENKNPGMLGISRDKVAVAPGASGVIDVLSITGSGRKLVTVTTGMIGDVPGLPFQAAFEGGSLYVLATGWLNLPRHNHGGQFDTVRGMSLQKFNLADGKRLWATELEDRGLYLPMVLPMVLGRGHVVVTARHTLTSRPYYVHIVDCETGRDVQKIDLQGRGRAGAAIANEQQRRSAMSPPVLTNGRLVVETAEGVSVHGEK